MKEEMAGVNRVWWHCACCDWPLSQHFIFSRWFVQRHAYHVGREFALGRWP